MPFMQKSAITGLFLVLLIQSVWSSSSSFAQDAVAVDPIAQRAINAQKANDFDFAATQWEEVIKADPDSAQVGIAHYQAGFCYVQTGQFAKAADQLAQSIGKLDPADKNSVAQAHLFLGFSQAKLGRELQKENRQESDQWLTSSTQTFVKLLKSFPSFEDADQALFFQGDAFEALGRWEEAADSYTKMLQLKDPEFKLDGLFALGFIRSEQGRYEQALKLYDQFEADGIEHPSFTEVRFRSGETLMQLARAAENSGDQNQQIALLEQAAKKFDTVFKSRDKNWSDQARFQQATATQKMGRFGDSARLFQSVMEIESSKLVDRARVYAGRDFLKAGDANAAALLLEKAVAVPSPYAAEAAHWMAQLYLRSKQPEKAYTLAADWVGKAKDVVVKAPLMLDQADAAYAIESRRKEAQELYLKIVRDYPADRLAPSALYNAAYAAMETGQFDESSKLTQQFRKAYPQSDYLPDVLEVEADSFLLGSKPEAAEQSFNELIQKFAGHPKAPTWKLRIGLAKYLQKKYETTIADLAPLLPSLGDSKQQAEALHWIGSSHFQLGQYGDAITQLEKSLTTDNAWRRADETLLTLSRSFYAAGKPAEAKKTTELLTTNFPKSNLVAEASYRLGEFAYQAKDYPQAMEHYFNVIEKSEASPFAPYAMYGIGWSQLQTEKPNDAVESFSKLIEAFPKHALAQDVLVGRATAFRQLGKLDLAIGDAQAYLNLDGKLAKQEEALNEMGLAQISKADWPAAVKTFENLLAVAPESKSADRYHYEIAWAHRSNKGNAAGLKHFEAIASKFPDSPLAAEANFHVAQEAYKQDDFVVAADKFQAAVDKSDYSQLSDPREIAAAKEIKEKAIYKLALSHFRSKNFDRSLTTFQQQLQEFPKGKLSADAMFMVSESLYENKKYKEAAQKYWVAKPVMEDAATTVSPNNKIRTFLHGAQAANQAKEYQRTIEFVDALSKLPDVNKNIQQDAQMELADAYRAMNNPEKAMAAYTAASMHPGATGARSMFMMGELLFDQKSFPEAIDKFKLVGYGYGGFESQPEVKPWQAFAAYEAGRCNLLLASVELSPAVKTKQIAEAKKYFDLVVNKFPNDKLVPQAKSELQKLESVQ